MPGPYRLPWPAARRDYDRACALGDCPHGVPGGDVIRPWCGTPACALCRRLPRCWRTPIDALIAGAVAEFAPPSRPPPALFD